MATLHALVDRLAEWKVNHLELYAEHTFAYPDHEVVWRDASPFTAGGDRGARRVLRGPPRHARPEPELPRPHEPLAAPRAVPRAGDGPRGLRDDGHAAAAEHDRAHRSRRRSRSCAACSASCSATSPTRRYVHVGLDEPWELPARALRRLPRVGRDAARAARGRRPRAAGVGRHPRPAPRPARRAARRRDRVRVGLRRRPPVGRRACGAFADAGIPRWVAPGHVGVAHDPRPHHQHARRHRRGRRRRARARRRRAAQHRLGRQRAPAVPAGERSRDSRTARRCAGARPRTATSTSAPRSSAHCYDDPTGELGAVVVELGDVHRRLTPQVWNVASLVLPLYFPQLDLGRGPLQGAARRGVRRGRRRPRRARGPARALRRAPAPTPRCSPTSCATRSRWCGCSRPTPGPASTSAARSPRSARRPAAGLADALRPVIAEHERLWLARNRPGGLRESRAWLEHLLGCYETGVTDRGWSGPAVTAGRRSEADAAGDGPRPARGAAWSRGATGSVGPTANGCSPPRSSTV